MRSEHERDERYVCILLIYAIVNTHVLSHARQLGMQAKRQDQ